MKKVKIIGLSVNQDLGILKACQLKFDENNKLIVFKGGVGDGKTTAQTAIQLGTQGSKTLIDKKLYGEIDIETQLIDGETPVFIGCKSSEKGVDYVLYTKDSEGKKVKNPVIDGISATPAEYLKLLQTELTWRMDELTSENSTTQRNILLKLYQNELNKIGVVFDKKASTYEGSILDKIEKAEEKRNYADMVRKQKGGIKDDLIKNGVDPDRPDTLPDRVDINEIDKKINELEYQVRNAATLAETKQKEQLQAIKLKASELTNKAIEYNQKLEREYNEKRKEFEAKVENQKQIESIQTSIFSQINELVMRGGINNDQAKNFIDSLKQIVVKGEFQSVEVPDYLVNEMGRIVSYSGKDAEASKIMQDIQEKRVEYEKIENTPINVVTTKIQAEIDQLKNQKTTAEETNKIVEAVDSFHAWRDENEKVVNLKNEYIKLLAGVNTGVDGLKISLVDDEIFLTYNGKYDTKYFGNEEMEDRKLSSYSGTQKPVICLLIQEYLLSQKPKALKYMFMDNIPIDHKTRVLLEKMATELDITVFLNITGDFTRESIKNGEVLIEGGEVFFEGLGE